MRGGRKNKDGIEKRRRKRRKREEQTDTQGKHT